MEYKEIIKKHKELIDIAIEHMTTISDKEHNENHMYDVVEATCKILDRLNIKVNKEVCIISAFWHDVGRTKTRIGHEKESSEMLKDAMKELNYDDIFIEQCSKAIINHKWNMIPETPEGLVVKDADKLCFLGKRRWNCCIKNNQDLDSIIESLPNLKNKILYFDETKELYDEYIIDLIKLMYEKIYNK